MSDMQLYLIALGAIIIASVILFNWWQERRLSQDAIRRFDSPAEDALLAEHPIDRDRDIDFDDSTIQIEESFDMVVEVQEPELEDFPEDTLLSELPGTSEGEFSETFPQASNSLADPLETPDSADAEPETDEETVLLERGLPYSMDEQIDLVALLHLNRPLTGAELRESLQPLPGFEKATQWFGCEDTGSWHALIKDMEQASFNRMACALQFADRSGPVSRECVRKFQHRVEAAAESLEAGLEWRGNGDPLRYATELDQFCIDVDVMVGFHIVNGSNGPFAATKLRGIAEAGGMKLHDDGTFHYETEDGETLFSLVNRDQHPFTPELLRTAFIRGISFQMDVPRVRNCPEAFNQMALLARKMESSLGGMLIDDNQHLLSAEAIEKIRSQLRIIYAKMVARGVIPGSPSALRLFS